MSTAEKISMGRNRTGTGVGSSILHEDRELLLVSSGQLGTGGDGGGAGEERGVK